MKRIITAAILLAAVLRFAMIWASPLWYDENYSLALAMSPLRNMLAATAGDVHPPLHYLTIWPIGQIITDPISQAWMIRLPSAVFSLIALWVFWRILEEFALPENVKIAAVILMAVAPFQVYYGQEGRMYALLEMLVLLVVLAMLRRYWTLMVMFMAAMLYTQNYGLFYAAAILLAGLVLRLPWRPLIVVGAVSGMLWLPWAGVLAWQMGAIHGTYWFPDMTAGHVIYTLLSLLFAKIDHAGMTLLTVTIFSGWMAFAGFWYIQRREILRDRMTQAMIILSAVPLVMAVGISLVYQPVLLFRPLIGITPFLYLLMVLPVATFNRQQQIMAAALVIPALLLNLGMMYAAPEHRGDDSVIPVLDTIETAWMDGDIVYHISDASMIGMLPYADISAGHHVHYHGCGVMLGQITDHTRRASGYQDAALDTLDYSRAWIITAETPLNPLCEAEYIDQYTDTVDPVYCFSDTVYIRSCLYLVNK